MDEFIWIFAPLWPSFVGLRQVYCTRQAYIEIMKNISVYNMQYR